MTKKTLRGLQDEVAMRICYATSSPGISKFRDGMYLNGVAGGVMLMMQVIEAANGDHDRLILELRDIKAQLDVALADYPSTV